MQYLEMQRSWPTSSLWGLHVSVHVFSKNIAEASVYGKRDGVLNGVAVTARDKGNIFKSSRGWKQGVVHSVDMLPRNMMWKPDNVPRLQVLDLLNLKLNTYGHDFFNTLQPFHEWQYIWLLTSPHSWAHACAFCRPLRQARHEASHFHTLEKLSPMCRNSNKCFDYTLDQLSNLLKPTAESIPSLVPTNLSMTWYDLMCWTKVAGGVDIIKKSLQSFVNPKAKANVLVDLAGYDGWPALAALEVGSWARWIRVLGTTLHSTFQ